MGMVIGMDLGDKRHVAVIFDAEGIELKTVSVINTPANIEKFSKKYPDSVVVMEAGTHSPWISRLLTKLGHEVVTGNPRKLRAIWDADDKCDERDARTLGLMYRLEPRLLHPVYHRSEESQCDLNAIKARNQLVECRVKLILYVRSAVKSIGERLPSCDTDSFHKRAAKHMPESLVATLGPMLKTIEKLTGEIKEYDRTIKHLCEEKYPETEFLQQVKGVSPTTALAYVLTLEEADRFEKSRPVGAFLGLTPRRDQSGDTDKQLRITKAGNSYLRKLLVGSAQYIMGPFGEDCDLRRYGERISARGGKISKRRAIIAVARKLAVLLHRLWKDQSVYIPLKGLQDNAC